MRVFRIALTKYGATAKVALNGQSGYSADGRWHTRGRYLDYASGSRSLATLERLVHYKRFNFLEPHMIYELKIPDEHIGGHHTKRNLKHGSICNYLYGSKLRNSLHEFQVHRHSLSPKVSVAPRAVLQSAAHGLKTQQNPSGMA